MQSEIKKAGLISSGGILLILLGIFLLYIKARYDAGAPCLRRDDFYPLSSRNILILASFGAIFIGILIELFGRFKLSQAANDMKIFYNRANFYFAAVLFILLSLLMFENETLFLVKICTNIDYDNPLTLLATGVFIVTSIFLLVLIVYFLLKDSIYLSRVF
ncbi:MAG: hypothetical protein LBP54_04115, partial [Campylobacteraceae bacterium]|nr:hypothetical protein [Campylobacteraceae bacterium]